MKRIEFPLVPVGSPHEPNGRTLARPVRALYPPPMNDKLLRTLRVRPGASVKIADHDPWTMPATIDDPAILDEIAGALKIHGV